MPREKPERAFLTPPEIAAEIGVRPETVVGWIRAGELRGADVARRGSVRPRFKVRRDDFDEFLSRRAVCPKARTSSPAAPRRPLNGTATSGRNSPGWSGCGWRGGSSGWTT